MTAAESSEKAGPKSPPTPMCYQRVGKGGRIHVSRRGWLLRILVLAALSLIIAIMISYMIRGNLITDPIFLFALIVPAHSMITFITGWFIFKSPAAGRSVKKDYLVSVIIPAYNQKSMIESVVDAIFQSRYKNIEVIVVNDGSNDGTKEVLDSMASRYHRLKVIHKNNEGKRKAVAAGFNFTEGDPVVLIDSDSILDSNAILELIKAFDADPNIGGAVGHVKVLNANRSVITKCQDVWYDFQFNLTKASESVFGSVMCISGCLAAYRRHAIQDFIPYWMEAKLPNSDDRELTAYVMTDKLGKSILTERRVREMKPSVSEYLKKAAAKYDDAEDRLLTAQSLERFKTVYVPSAIVYTDVPESLRKFLKQQLRWKKGTMRTNFFVSSFFWKKRHPVMTFIFYLSFMSTFSAPLIAFALVFYLPFIRNEIIYPLLILGSTALLEGFVVGIDYKMRDPSARNWIYKPVMHMISQFILSMILFPALWSLRKNTWGTR